VPSVALSAQWPSVKPMARSFNIDFADRLVVVDVPIVAENGSPLYVLHCRGGAEKGLDELGSRDGINWVGPLMCVLNNANSAISENSLFAEDGSPPWHTRGQFHSSELIGACGAYPEFGNERSFRLRGFVLRLNTGNVSTKPDGSLRHLTLVVTVKNDATAQGAQAERPDYRQPRSGDCAVVRRGRDPRMCRVWSGATFGSWAPCPKQ
jgi:hypothetical protein